MTITEQRQLVAQAETLAGGAQRLAAVLGVRPSTVYRWLNGTRRMHGMAVRAVEGFITETEARNG
jgi:DNA-binding transcriptional regulator YdaS (Cro superfamily)